MLNARGANEVPRTSTIAESSSLVSSNDGGQLATVDKLAPLTRSRDSKFREATSIISLPLETSRPRSRRSRDASPESAIDPMSEEKFPSHPRRSLKNPAQAIGTRDRSAWSKELTSIGDETYRDSMADEGGALSPPRKPAKRGLRTMIRRLFGRKLAKSRISMPAPAPTTYLANVSLPPPALEIDGGLTHRKGPKYIHHVCGRPDHATLHVCAGTSSVPFKCPGITCPHDHRCPRRSIQARENETRTARPVPSGTAGQITSSQPSECNHERGGERREKKFHTDGTRVARRRGRRGGWC